MVRRVLKFLKFNPYKLYLVQEKYEYDPVRLLQFCDKVNTNAHFIFKICFSDDYLFFLNET